MVGKAGGAEEIRAISRVKTGWEQAELDRQMQQAVRHVVKEAGKAVAGAAARAAANVARNAASNVARGMLNLLSNPFGSRPGDSSGSGDPTDRFGKRK